MKILFIAADRDILQRNALSFISEISDELIKTNPFSKFNNHSAHLSLDIFDEFNHNLMRRVDEVVFEEFAVSGKYGLIIPYADEWNPFDNNYDWPCEWKYGHHVREIYEKSGVHTDFYYVGICTHCDYEKYGGHKDNLPVEKMMRYPPKAWGEEAGGNINDGVYIINGIEQYENFITINIRNKSAVNIAAAIKNVFDI